MGKAGDRRRELQRARGDAEAFNGLDQIVNEIIVWEFSHLFLPKCYAEAREIEKFSWDSLENKKDKTIWLTIAARSYELLGKNGNAGFCYQKAMDVVRDFRLGESRSKAILKGTLLERAGSCFARSRLEHLRHRSAISHLRASYLFFVGGDLAKAISNYDIAQRYASRAGFSLAEHNVYKGIVRLFEDILIKLFC